jgi:hypothetical protein
VNGEPATVNWHLETADRWLSVYHASVMVNQSESQSLSKTGFLSLGPNPLTGNWNLVTVGRLPVRHGLPFEPLRQSFLRTRQTPSAGIMATTVSAGTR